MKPNPCMYIFINSNLGMSPGKIAAQAGHAAVEAFRKGAVSRELVEQWLEGGHYKKIVLDGGDTQSMQMIDRYLRDRGFESQLIIDEGRTEGTYMVPTAIGVPVVDKNDPHVAATFGTFKSLKPKPQQPQPDSPFESFKMEKEWYPPEPGRWKRAFLWLFGRD